MSIGEMNILIGITHSKAVGFRLHRQSAKNQGREAALLFYGSVPPLGQSPFLHVVDGFQQFDRGITIQRVA